MIRSLQAEARYGSAGSQDTTVASRPPSVQVSSMAIVAILAHLGLLVMAL